MPKSLVALLLSLAATLWPAPAVAQDGATNAEAFYQTAIELKKKGVRAMFDRRTKPMMREMEAAGKAAKQENDAATAAGRPVYCVPEAARKQGLSADKVVEMLGRMPAERRKRLTLQQAWREVLIREYPCR